VQAVGSFAFDIEDFSTTYIFVKCILFWGRTGEGERRKVGKIIFHNLPL
jgi:hypothetical protein